MQADVSASLEPSPTTECNYNVFSKSKHSHNTTETSSDYESAFEYAFASTINGLPCSFPLHSGTDLRQFTALICEGRRLLGNLYQGLLFALSSFLALFILLFINLCMDAPPMYNGFQLIWVLWVIIPLLVLSMLATD